MSVVVLIKERLDVCEEVAGGIGSIFSAIHRQITVQCACPAFSTCRTHRPRLIGPSRLSNIIAFPVLISHRALGPLVVIRVPNKIGVTTSDRAPCLYPDVGGIYILLAHWRLEDKIVIKELFEGWEKGEAENEIF